MKTIFQTIVAVSIVAVTISGHSQTLESTSIEATIQQSEDKSEADLLVIRRFSVITADGGLQGLSPGTRVTLLRIEDNGDYVISDGVNEGTAQKHFFTRDKDMAEHARFQENRQSQAMAENHARLRQKAEARKAFESRMKNEGKEIHVEITQVLPEGVLADKLKANYTSSNLQSIGGGGGLPFISSYTRSGTVIFIKGLKVIAEGKRMAFIGLEDGTYSFTDTDGASRTVECWIFGEEKE